MTTLTVWLQVVPWRLAWAHCATALPPDSAHTDDKRSPAQRFPGITKEISASPGPQWREDALNVRNPAGLPSEQWGEPGPSGPLIGLDSGIPGPILSSAVPRHDCWPAVASRWGHSWGTKVPSPYFWTSLCLHSGHTISPFLNGASLASQLEAPWAV